MQDIATPTYKMELQRKEELMSFIISKIDLEISLVLIIDRTFQQS